MLAKGRKATQSSSFFGFNEIKQDAPEAIISAQLLVKNNYVAHLVAQSERYFSVAMATLFP